MRTNIIQQYPQPCKSQIQKEEFPQNSLSGNTGRWEREDSFLLLIFLSYFLWQMGENKGKQRKTF
jgi:hypothetical protein